MNNPLHFVHYSIHTKLHIIYITKNQSMLDIIQNEIEEHNLAFKIEHIFHNHHVSETSQNIHTKTYMEQTTGFNLLLQTKAMTQVRAMLTLGYGD